MSAPKAKPYECPYCGPFQRCQAAEPSECWAETDDNEANLEPDVREPVYEEE